MTRRNLTIRREQNQKLAEAEAKARCASCHAPLLKIGVVVLLHDLEGRTFCSDPCAEDFEDAQTRTGR